MVEKRSRVFERKVGEYLNKQVRTTTTAVHRFPDTLAARGAYLPAQPGDFMVLLPGNALLIEVKTSAKAHTLKDCLELISPQQLGQHTLWLRAGHPATFLFEGLRGNLNTYEAWASVRVLAMVRKEVDLSLCTAEVWATDRKVFLGGCFGTLERLRFHCGLCKLTNDELAL